MIRRRFAIRFALQLAMTGLFLVAIAIMIVIWVLGRLEDIEINRNFAPMGISRLISEAEVDSKGLIVDSVFIKQLKADGGWLQSLDSNGNVVQSFNTPTDLPSSYIPGQLMDYWLDKETFPYKLGLWIQEKDGHYYTLLYGAPKSPTKELLQQIINDGLIHEQQISFSYSTIVQLNKSGSWVQVLDRKGMEVASWEKPKDAVTSYTIQELAMRSHNQAMYGIVMDTKYDKKKGLTWVLQSPIDKVTSSTVPAPFFKTEAQVIIMGITAFLISALLIFILLSLWYANRFGTPVLSILGWIQKLGKGDYTNVQSENEGRNQKGDWKHGYRIFSEVMDSIHVLAITLQAGKDAEEQTQKNREDWIAGVTHDMKTPLASIQGYAYMLEAEKYSWSDEEVRQFASTIIEKTVYMNKLINDLALTYRLKNGVIPINIEEKDLCCLLSDSVLRATSHPMYENSQVNCITPSTPIMARIYPQGFDRIVDNIVANGLIHNSSGTKMDIELVALPENGWHIDFKDNGKGMDQQTIERLFDRYYRGTNTNSAIEGSGLGMAVTKELVQAMGGQIKVNSKVGHGTVISIIWSGS
ncbi:HAMP domain-containing sensor histidine kinase [Bacillus sp. JJ664]